MSATETSTIPLPSTDSYTSIDRVAQIPFIHDMLSAVISALEANAYTRYGYGTAKDLSATVYKYAQPYEPRFAPVLHTADGFANKTLDTVQGKFPDAFVAKPEDLVSYVRDSVNARRDSVSKVIDLRVKTPAVAVAENVDRVCLLLLSPTSFLILFRVARDLLTRSRLWLRKHLMESRRRPSMQSTSTNALSHCPLT